MKNLLLVAALVLTATISQAAPRGSNGTNSVTGVFGFAQSALNFGANFEHRVDSNMGVGGYFLLSSEKENDNIAKNQTLTFGGFMPLHFMNDSEVDLYLAPGFGVTMIKGIGRANDETVFGPSIHTGITFKLTSTVKAGIENVYLTNWFNDKAPYSVQYTNAVVNFGF